MLVPFFSILVTLEELKQQQELCMYFGIVMMNVKIIFE